MEGEGTGTETILSVWCVPSSRSQRLNQRIEAVLQMNMRFVGEGSVHDG